MTSPPNDYSGNLSPVLCSVADAARALGIGKTKTYALISEQMLDTVTIGSRRLVTVESIGRLVERARMDVAA
ncbi:hypothetical protein Ga0102493_112928 [Erythrobacter litoralis]|uniref:Helix-turn-helix domain-containing protein n=1 Tax=Erythrobacter litoralis TaxID=39960 RepID=A0A074N351_9SPHN|nr:helix-turn-helix domain-containing protein [Erythrobacter litoralis]AOL23931.1 hypothetical protein Ga0102493_112928 [Erythrobacter litoralis]KEO98588.1 hypothetical protein EH32_05645 [Erythrobacter litoralis]